jgi:16S rRNA (cytidine1402-2'-O)-methyltransferase
MKQGVLYIVATPIGNLSDISQRAIDVLANVDLIAAEDTRHSRHLLSHFQIATPLLAYHDHNEQSQTPQLVEKLQSGLSIALISDAGTPLLSDPGYRLVKAAHDQRIRVSPIPGACAAIAALSASGLATDQFCFAGFPPARTAARRQFYEVFKQQPQSVIFYESSHRILDSLRDLCAVVGEQREVLLARELTKTFETLRRSPLGELVDWVAGDENQRKGEFVLIQAGADEQPDEHRVQVETVLDVLMSELPLKQASALTARITGAKKNQVYKMALAKNGES